MTRLTPTQLTDLRHLAMRADACAMHYYTSKFDVSIKTDDSPVTQADLAVSELLETGLPRIADYPVLSEENQPKDAIWRDWETYWLIDPIDGTRHFINGSGEFCICIALIHRNQAIFGLIGAPTSDQLWLGQIDPKGRSHQLEKYHYGRQIPLPTDSCQRITVVTGTRALSHRFEVLLSQLSDYDFYSRGSALKFIDIVEGKATMYPKMWDICEWDCAAGQCLLTCAGGDMVRFDSDQPIVYGAASTLLSPHFLAYRNLSAQQLALIRKMYPQVPPFLGDGATKN